ncbi:hypothetical protein LSH36_63g06035 [Paralvinella palmiformis]|uniref:LysM domain-containing protein n=1 Tax=Paralvinella palmiformis TaxID=53620 RepID=A0AAD9K5M6_9ANNE|nr:hypothetical protein LSH36_63g06035 [Paralvinella palmiformis]
MSSRSSKRGVKGTCYQYRGLDKDTAQHSNNPFGGTVQVQNVKGARVYIWGDADVDEEEILNDDTEKHELRARGRLKANTCPDQENTTLTIERPVLTGETLQKIAVKFACEVAELKRINNLLTDQDFFALTSIKVPILKYGLMRETLEEEIRQNAGTLGVGSTNGAAVTLGVGASNDSSFGTDRRQRLRWRRVEGSRQ